jgi:hypothetical protein
VEAPNGCRIQVAAKVGMLSARGRSSHRRNARPAEKMDFFDVDATNDKPKGIGLGAAPKYLGGTNYLGGRWKSAWQHVPPRPQWNLPSSDPALSPQAAGFLLLHR